MIKEYQLSSIDLWREINNDFQQKGGAYKLLLKNNTKTVPINRFLGTDDSGILYIVKANCYLDRILALRKTIDPNLKSKSHICGRRYNKNEKIKEQFPYANLFIQLIEDQYPEIKERELIDDYFNRFGEVPPLNANG